MNTLIRQWTAKLPQNTFSLENILICLIILLVLLIMFQLGILQASFKGLFIS
jgi:hypothetical protein